MNLKKGILLSVDNYPVLADSMGFLEMKLKSHSLINLR